MPKMPKRMASHEILHGHHHGAFGFELGQAGLLRISGGAGFKFGAGLPKQPCVGSATRF